MNYNSRLIDIFKKRKFRKLTGRSHTALQKKNGYFAVFLNDSVSDDIQITGLYEKEILVPLINVFQEKNIEFNGLFIDAGANLGNHTIFFSDYFDYVYSFEPNPVTYKLLDVNTYFQRDKITINNFGLSDKNEKLKLSVMEGNIGASSTVNDYDGRIYETIEVVKLDDYFKSETRNIRLLKIDVEGMENKVLIGGSKTINKHRPIILFELWESAFENKINQSIELLKDWGYEIFKLIESNFSNNKLIRRFKRLSLVIFNGSLKYELMQLEDIKPSDYPMLIAIHNSQKF